VSDNFAIAVFSRNSDVPRYLRGTNPQTVRTKFVRCQFAITVFIQRLQAAVAPAISCASMLPSLLVSGAAMTRILFRTPACREDCYLSSALCCPGGWA